MIPTVTSGDGRPADESRDVATVPSEPKCSFGDIVEIIMGASLCPNS